VRARRNRDFPRAFLPAWRIGVQSFDVPTSNCLPLQLSFPLTPQPSLYPGDETPLGRDVCTGDTHMRWGGFTNAERFCYLAFCSPSGGFSPLCISSLALFSSVLCLTPGCASSLISPPHLALPFPSQLFCLLLRTCSLFLVLGK